MSIFKIIFVQNVGQMRVLSNERIRSRGKIIDCVCKLNAHHAGIGSTEQNCVCFLTFQRLFQRLFHEIMNQYQACVYLSECIFHCGFKYGHEIPQFRKKLQILLNF